jgi:hypothetical protein
LDALTVSYLGFYGYFTVKMEALRSIETSGTINHAKLRTEDLALQQLYYGGVRCNYHYFDSEYSLPFINFFQNMAWSVFIYNKPPL